MFINLWLRIIVLCVYTTPFACGYINLANGGSSFSSAIKAFHYDKLCEEVVLYKSYFGQAGYVTEQWFTGQPFDQNAILQVYIDGEPMPSLEYSLYMAQSISPKRLPVYTPWSTREFGQLASGGGIFNTFRIPFLSEIKITLKNNVKTGYLWYIVRGVLDVDLVVGSFQLPNVARLNVYKVDEVLEPLKFVTLSNTTNKAGFLFLVNFDIESATPVFMEGCVRAMIDSSNSTTFLSSGTEDFFLSAYYFNRGLFQGFQSGLTSFTTGDSYTQITAYKFFIDDPIIFKQSLQLIWRNFETADGPNGCPSHFTSNPNIVPESALPKTMFGLDPAPAHIKSYVWVYEWPTN